MKKLAATLLITVLQSVFVAAQVDSTIHVKGFPGNDVGTKLLNAMQTCPAAPIPCILQIDPSLASAAAGTIPSLCGNCFVQDWRSGPPASSAVALIVGQGGYSSVAAAISALPSAGGTVATPPGWTETDVNLAVGSSTKKVTLQAGAGTTINVTGSTGIQLFNGSSMICMSSIPNCQVVSQQTSAGSLLTNGQQDGSQEYFYVSGFSFNCGTTVAYTNGCVYIDGVFVPSALNNVVINAFSNSIGLHITSTVNTNGGTNVLSIVNSWINGESNTAAQPVVIDRSGSGVTSEINWYGGAIENPGIGEHSLLVDGATSTFQLFGIGFFGTQVQGTASNTVSSVYIVDAQDVAIHNMLFNGQPSGEPCIELNKTTGLLAGIVIENVRCSSSANTPAVKNDVSGYATISGNYIEPFYAYQGTSAAEPFVFDGSIDFTSPPSSSSSIILAGAQPTGIIAGSYTSGITTTGSIGQTCLLTFSNGGTATVALTGTNAIAGGTALTITAAGSASYTAEVTTATVSAGTASACSGTPVLVGDVGIVGTGSTVVVANNTVTVPALAAGQCVSYTSYWQRGSPYVSAQTGVWTISDASLNFVTINSSSTTSTALSSSKITICNNPGTTAAQTVYAASAYVGNTIQGVGIYNTAALNFTTSHALQWKANFAVGDYYVPMGVVESAGP